MAGTKNDAPQKPWASVILAAGQGTRMASPLPKVLHKLAGRTLLDRAIDAVEEAGAEKIIVVVGPHAPEVAAHVRKRLSNDAIAVQDPPLGTAHAVLAAYDALKDFDGRLLITYADTPLLDAEILRKLVLTDGPGPDLHLLGFHSDDPNAYGRLILKPDGDLSHIVEAKDATAEEFEIKLCNSGVLSGESRLIFQLIQKIGNKNAKGEYYLTDLFGLAQEEGRNSKVIWTEEIKVLGVNSQMELSTLESFFQKQMRKNLQARGVTMIAPETLYFSYDTEIASGALIEPYVVFGPGVRIGRAEIRAFSHIEGATIADGAVIGPYARLRPGTDIAKDVHIGNFVELKATTMGEGSKANHLSYLGDGIVGAKANIGAGTIFCNYDGFDKHLTKIGDGAFIGSHTALIAPVIIGEGSYIGSGSVITRNVAPDSLTLSRSPQTEKPQWAKKFRQQKSHLSGS